MFATPGWSRHPGNELPTTAPTTARRPRAGRRLLVLLAFLGILATGCAELAPTEMRKIERGGTSLRGLLDPDSIAIPGTDSSDVVDALGEPAASEEADPPKDQRPGTVITLRYDGLEVVVRELRKPARSFISDLTITDREYVTSLPVRVGGSRDEIEEVLGEPREAEDGGGGSGDGDDGGNSEAAATPSTGEEVVYALNDDGDRCIVTYEGDRATRMHFTFS